MTNWPEQQLSNLGGGTTLTLTDAPAVRIKIANKTLYMVNWAYLELKRNSLTIDN